MAFFFVTPRYIKDARALHGAAKKIYHYRCDLLTESQRQEFKDALQELAATIKLGNKEKVLAAMQKVDELAGGIAPSPSHAGWRENCEVLLVAIVIAAGVRAYFIQPFKIPTGSMQPTLNGIIAHASDEPFPNPVTRFLEFFILGRNYIDVRSTVDDAVVSLKEETWLNFFIFTKITCEKESYTAFAPITQIQQDFGVRPGRLYKAGEVIARGVIDTGDQVLVDKISYHFFPPKQGDVFVFKTLGIRRIQASLPPGVESQHYIKRLAGMPGQTLRIAPPLLFINGQVAWQKVFQRVMSCRQGYHGYSNGLESGFAFQYLGSPQATFQVPPHKYFALGDNSFHSSDSRNWGTVPDTNVAGRGVVVYWPISPRWGFIH